MAITNKGASLELYCDSADTLPVEGYDVNTIATELDTGKKYYFDGTAWTEIGSNTGD